MVLAKEDGFISMYLSILHALDWDANREIYQTRLGRLFGYDPEDCEEFARKWTPEFCQCSKCVGVLNANPEVR